jgi:penicillin-binding protein 2
MNDEQQFGSRTRKNIFMAIVGLVALAFVGRLVQLQLIEGQEYRQKSEAQGIKRNVREPNRGAIYDRYGRLLVGNVPAYSISVVPNKLTPEVKWKLATVMRVDTAEIDRLVKQFKTNDYSPVKIFRDVTYADFARLSELHTELPGIDIEEDSKREYTSEIRASHILGYIGPISEGELKTAGDYYLRNDLIGKNGVEKAWETELRGEKGYEFLLVNNRGKRVGSFNNGNNDLKPFNGFDLYLGVDAQLQQYAEQLLRPYHGAVVALDPSTGEILAMASAPDYDLRIFSGSRDRDAIRALKLDTNNVPEMNRATQAVYPSGSTWKMLMSIAGLMSGTITPQTTISCPGSFTFGGNTWKCHGAHGAVNVQKSIHVSCNVFYYKLVLQLGIDNYYKYAHLFHFGEKISPDITEGGTLMPSRGYMDKKYGKDRWRGPLVNLGIGQGDMLVNPLQLAAYCAAIANNGVWNKPHMVRAVRNRRLNNEIDRVRYDPENLGISMDILKVIQEGMYDVVNTPGGTARAAKLDSIIVAGKTGTAQAGKGKKDHAWFVCYAPFDKPKIALCVLVENSGFGGTYSAPIARKLIRFFLTRQREAGDEVVDHNVQSPYALPSIMPDSGDSQESDLIPAELMPE